MAKTKGHEVLKAMSEIRLTGNIIPSQWFWLIGKKNKKGVFKADLLAINILAEVCYWYRLSVKRDEESGEVIGHQKKFMADKLQLNYEQMAERFGSTKIACKRSSDLLVKLGCAVKDFRHITLKSGAKIPNCLFIEPCPEWIRESVAPKNEVTEAERGEELKMTSLQKSKDMLTKNGGSPYEKVKTNTETTTKNTTENKTVAKATETELLNSEFEKACTYILEKTGCKIDSKDKWHLVWWYKAVKTDGLDSMKIAIKNFCHNKANVELGRWDWVSFLKIQAKRSNFLPKMKVLPNYDPDHGYKSQIRPELADEYENAGRVAI